MELKFSFRTSIILDCLIITDALTGKLDLGTSGVKSPLGHKNFFGVRD